MSESIKYQVLYYLKEVSGCQLQKGFFSRAEALIWVKSFWNYVDWYKIEEES